MKYLCIVLFVLFPVMMGCATKQPLDIPLERITVTAPEEYKLDTSSIPEVEPPAMIPLQQSANGYIVNELTENPDAVAIPSGDLPKIVAMLKVKNLYIDISKEQVTLINLERQKAKGYQDLYALERDARILERDMLNLAEKSYKAERKAHRIDNAINRTAIVALIATIGFVL